MDEKPLPRREYGIEVDMTTGDRYQIGPYQRDSERDDCYEDAVAKLDRALNQGLKTIRIRTPLQDCVLKAQHIIALHKIQRDLGILIIKTPEDLGIKKKAWWRIW